MKHLSFILSLFFLFVISCKNDTKTEVCDQCDGLFSETLVMQIDNDYFACSDGSGDECLHVQFSSIIDENAWEEFNQEICGFDFEPGYRYSITVKRKKIDKDSDGNPIYKYCLVSLDKKTIEYLK